MLFRSDGDGFFGAVEGDHRQNRAKDFFLGNLHGVGHAVENGRFNECHPFYTGKQKTLDTGGRVQRFADRFGAFGKKPAATPAE